MLVISILGVLTGLADVVPSHVCGNYCGPGWCGAEYVDEGPACDFDAGPEGWNQPAGPSCADQCCKNHDSCCGLQSDTSECNGIMIDCLRACPGDHHCHRFGIPVPNSVIEAAIAAVYILGKCCASNCPVTESTYGDGGTYGTYGTPSGSPPLETVLQFVVTGGCDSLSAVHDGVEYTAAGYTASGAPYYRDSSSVYYIYWDPDCNAGGAPAAWIVDNDEPSTSASSDLDGDGQCAYYAYIDSGDSSSPLLGMSTWQVVCDGSFTDNDLTLARPSPSPPPSPPAPPSPPLATVLPFVITGGCSTQPDVLDGLDGVEYAAAGYTASGAPYYRDSSSSFYIYWDPDCNAGGAPAAWIVDNDEPSTSASSDLDGDGRCAYNARINSQDSSSPPLGTNTWRVVCDGSFTDNDLTLARPSPSPPPSPPAPPSPPLATVLPFVITGGCASLSNVLDGVEYAAAGYTASGAPYYRGSSSSFYIYWDPDCNAGGQPARWIGKDLAPSTSASSDLDGDGQCFFQAHIESGDSSSPPLGTRTWQVSCGGSFTDNDLTLARPSPSPPPSPPAPPSPPLATVLPFVITGGCASVLDGVEYTAAGYTASGAPYTTATPRRRFTSTGTPTATLAASLPAGSSTI